MSLRHITHSIRTRITLWHLGVLIATLAVYILTVQIFLWHQLTSELQTNLQEEAEEVARLFLKRSADGHFVWRGHQESTKQIYWIGVSHLDGVLIYRNFPRADFTLPAVPTPGCSLPACRSVTIPAHPAPARRQQALDAPGDTAD